MCQSKWSTQNAGVVSFRQMANKMGTNWMRRKVREDRNHGFCMVLLALGDFWNPLYPILERLLGKTPTFTEHEFNPGLVPKFEQPFGLDHSKSYQNGVKPRNVNVTTYPGYHGETNAIRFLLKSRYRDR